MPKRSAGLMPFTVERREDRSVLRVMLVHPGGPYWAKKDAGSWSICKGELDEEHGEDPEAAARREFREELGVEPPAGDLLPLGEVKQPGGKTVIAWGVDGYLDVSEIESNEFAIEWPPRTGRMQSFPEVDRAQWFDVAEARWRILTGQVAFLDTLMGLAGRALDEGEPGGR
jgi:predicted NUDIX family NTP pyrophosphohydrolase